MGGVDHDGVMISAGAQKWHPANSAYSSWPAGKAMSTKNGDDIWCPKMASSLQGVSLSGSPAKPGSVCVGNNDASGFDRLDLGELVRQTDEVLLQKYGTCNLSLT